MSKPKTRGKKQRRNEKTKEKRQWLSEKRQHEIQEFKNCHSVGIKLQKEIPERIPTPKPGRFGRKDYEENFKKWTKDVLNLEYSEETEISPRDVGMMLSEFRKSKLYRFYDENLPNNHPLKTLKIPKTLSEEMLRGDEWKEISQAFTTELGNITNSIKFKEVIVQIHAEKHPKSFQNVKSSDFEDYQAYVRRLNQVFFQIKNDGLILNRKKDLDFLKVTYKDEIKKNPENFEPWPSSEDTCTDQEWDLKIERTIARIKRPKKDKNRDIGKRYQALWQVRKSPEFQKMVTQRSQFRLIRLPSASLKIDDVQWFQKLQEVSKEIEEMVGKEAKVETFYQEICKFKKSQHYQDLVKLQRPRPQTPKLTQDAKYNEKRLKKWKEAIKSDHVQYFSFLTDRQFRDISAMKDTLLYMEYAKALHLGQVEPVSNPEEAKFLTLQEWELAFEAWKYELKSAVESKKKLGIDFKKISELDANQWLKYVQEKSAFYAKNCDCKFPDGRQFVGSIVGACIRFVPCAQFNKDNSCQEKNMVHTDENGEKRIHSCALCYFAMGGMLNCHRVIQCPLLAFE